MPILIFVFGTIIASFLNVCIYRIPRKESIIYPSSHCPHCGIPLKWYNLIPILSFIVQGGKCSYCKGKISLQYPVVEILNGIMFVMLYNKFGLNLDFLFYSILFSLLIVIFFIDMYYQIIPNGLNILILVFAVLNKILQNLFYNKPLNLIDSLLGLIISSGIFLLIIIVSKGAMGGGDMKLIGVLGFILGFKKIILTIFLSFIFGGLISILLLIFKIKSRKDPIAFGPFICLAFVFMVFWGDDLLFWYSMKLLGGIL
jgi:leader peptidase (prepilin peptidase)/N-methyltransferase